MRVAYFIAYPYRLAGANRSLLATLSAMSSRVNALVLVADEGRAARGFREAGLDVRVVRPPDDLMVFGRESLRWPAHKKVAVTLGALLPYSIRMARLLREEGIDIVHVNDPRGAILGGLGARLAGLPLVAHMRGEQPRKGLAWRPFEVLPARIITVCDAIQRDLNPATARKARTVYNGIEPPPMNGPRVDALEAARAAGRVVVCCMASICPFKGQHHLIGALGQLAQRGLADRMELVLVGDQPAEFAEYQAWLRQRIAAIGAPHVRLTGWQDDPFAYYRSADISVLTSVRVETLELGGRAIEVRGNEGFPRTHLEAMAFRLPVVGSDIAGVREQILDEVTGLLVPPADEGAIAHALERLITDAALRERLGAAGHARVRECFSTRRSAQGVLRVYEELLGEAE